MNSPRFLLSLGLILLLIGSIVPYLIVIQILPSTFTLSFLAWTATTSGMFLGTIGLTMWAKLNKE